MRRFIHIFFIYSFVALLSACGGSSGSSTTTSSTSSTSSTSTSNTTGLPATADELFSSSFAKQYTLYADGQIANSLFIHGNQYLVTLQSDKTLSVTDAVGTAHTLTFDASTDTYTQDSSGFNLVLKHPTTGGATGANTTMTFHYSTSTKQVDFLYYKKTSETVTEFIWSFTETAPAPKVSFLAGKKMAYIEGTTTSCVSNLSTNMKNAADYAVNSPLSVVIDSTGGMKLTLLNGAKVINYAYNSSTVTFLPESTDPLVRFSSINETLTNGDKINQLEVYYDATSKAFKRGRINVSYISASDSQIRSGYILFDASHTCP